eukprot:NODE_451_length_2239_cov_22.025114_g417_i0.p1 GENE.NODE_451_length_2239_cov_22.025114_g417_i0~~NODE_451_length_2239_cov_22.025114_g417_i0.p1  ORF type:complete len:206 (+),score=24.68 NODE_451_length_2239_cov_22.025114_g417_i0:48-665(+)
MVIMSMSYGPIKSNPGSIATNLASKSFHPYLRPVTTRTVVVSNISSITPDDSLKNAFSKIGAIEIFKVVPSSGPYKTAYVKFAQVEQCHSALLLFGQLVGNSTIQVQFAENDVGVDPEAYQFPPIDQWESPPAPPPQDKSLVKRIETMSDWYTNNVEKFLEVYNKKREDSQYGFMYDQHAEGVAYYNWRIFCVKQKWSPGLLRER